VLHHVADEDVLPRQVNGREDFGKQLPRRPDERPAARVLIGARRLADDDEVGLRVTSPGTPWVAVL
jgi:hypothetical protein